MHPPVEFVITGRPASANDPNILKQKWKISVASTAMANFSGNICPNPVSVHLVHFPPRRIHCDIDNIIKYTIDGLASVLFVNDCQVQHVTARRIVKRPLVPIHPTSWASVGALAAALSAQNSGNHGLAIRVQAPAQLSKRIW